MLQFYGMEYFHNEEDRELLNDICMDDGFMALQSCMNQESFPIENMMEELLNEWRSQDEKCVIFDEGMAVDTEDDSELLLEEEESIDRLLYELEDVITYEMDERTLNEIYELRDFDDAWDEGLLELVKEGRQPITWQTVPPAMEVDLHQDVGLTEIESSYMDSETPMDISMEFHDSGFYDSFSDDHYKFDNHSDHHSVVLTNSLTVQVAKNCIINVNISSCN